MKKLLIFLLAITGVASLSAAKLEVLLGSTKGRAISWVEITLFASGHRPVIKYRVGMPSFGFIKRTFNVSGGIEGILWECGNSGIDYYVQLSISRFSLRTPKFIIDGCDGSYTFKGKSLMAKQTPIFAFEEETILE